ncbi:vomeronasal type-1 receptor 4-like [Petaurus breviceps papuanus]|uniref:vomeronasal type-1 receptor 4-like n=1 Tax=Petaurus breviceps papuanus TaxID=3040969 RepID=UPI0036D7CB5D
MHSFYDFLCTFYMLYIIIGIYGNGSLLYLYGFNIITHQMMKPIGIIFVNLAFNNILMILLRGVPWTIHSCIQKFFLGDIKCKIIFYFQRVSRSNSVYAACLLCVFQAITIHSGSLIWSKLEVRSPKHIVSFCFFIWALNLLINGAVPLYVTGPRNNTNSGLRTNLGLCSVDKYVLNSSKLLIWRALYDALLMGLMAIASGYMVVVLYKHHWQVQHIHKTSVNPRSSPEIKATKVILFLMSIFVCSYSFISIFIIMIDNSKDINPWMIHASVVFSLCYPAISPFLLISSDSKIPYCYNAFKRMKNSIIEF